MATLEDIENAIMQPSPEDHARFLQWFRVSDNQAWDYQMDRDAAAAKLDFLRQEASEAGKSGLVRE